MTSVPSKKVEPSQSLSLKITSDTAQIAPVRRQVEQFLSDAGFDEITTAEMGLCLNEALTNIIRHAYHGAKDLPIQIDAQLADDSATIRLRDWGNGINPLSLPVKPAAIDPLEPGGLGMICLRKLTDVLLFVPQPDGMLLEMKRRRGETGSSDHG